MQNNQVQGVETDNIVKQIDYHKSTEVVKTVMQGKKFLRHVNVNSLRDDCVDLKQCIQQQNTVFGFLAT